MALRAGHRGPALGAGSVREPPDAFRWIAVPSVEIEPGQDSDSAFFVR